MPRRPEIGNVQLYPQRPLTRRDKNGFVLKFYCPILCKRIRKNCGTRDRREARRIQRECRERLLNGEYVRSDGAITAAQAQQCQSKTVVVLPVEASHDGPSWEECYDRYREHRATRIRESSLVHALSRLNVAERIISGYREDLGLPEGLPVTEVMTLDVLEYLQERLLAGDECRYDSRSPNTVNSMAAVMAFVRFCHVRNWIPSVPALEKLDADEVMKGRPITSAEFEQLLKATPDVVGKDAAASWQSALCVLWESGFRIGDLMDFHWDDPRRIHPVWPDRASDHPTIIIPSSQKNGRHQEVPMLPGLRQLLDTVPPGDRHGWVCAPESVQRGFSQPGERSHGRLTKERVSRIIALIGCRANIVVRPADKRTGQREKFASAHDLRRGCALRLINAGISAETLRLILRHSNFATTEKFYGAIRSAQSAAAEVNSKLNPELVGGFLGGNEKALQFSTEELSKLKSLLNSL